ncbi:hypothetical protein TNCT_154941 [Trichonephila clavata]|uniref:Uncharacterized protein n=1 Tax=Trichonephila clavata TaxID=2740835 RepID=A0A8X6HMN0_TRICU|nr:hypothetical protein TNCT_154941 [Trichonephila clavata]
MLLAGSTRYPSISSNGERNSPHAAGLTLRFTIHNFDVRKGTQSEAFASVDFERAVGHRRIRPAPWQSKCETRRSLRRGRASRAERQVVSRRSGRYTVPAYPARDQSETGHPIGSNRRSAELDETRTTAPPARQHGHVAGFARDVVVVPPRSAVDGSRLDERQHRSPGRSA